MLPFFEDFFGFFGFSLDFFFGSFDEFFGDFSVGARVGYGLLGVLVGLFVG